MYLFLDPTSPPTTTTTVPTTASTTIVQTTTTTTVSTTTLPPKLDNQTVGKMSFISNKKSILTKNTFENVRKKSNFKIHNCI